MIKYIDRLDRVNLTGRVALIRTGFDIRDGENIFRLTKSIPTIQFLRERGAIILIISHRGRPHGKEKKWGLRHFVPILSKKLKTPVTFLPHFRFPEIRRVASFARPGSVFLLENLRFHPGEQSNSALFARQLASCGSFFVNEAFSVSHREAASLVAITRFLPSYGGLLLKEEIKNLSRAMKNTRHPFVLILGGAKISDKIDLVQHFIRRVDHIIVGGAVANMFLALHGIPLRSSYIERDSLPIADMLLRRYAKKIVMPLDWVRDAQGAIKDIGPKTIRLFSSFIKNARVIVWNGPMGYTEAHQFRKGTRTLAYAISKSRAFSVAGGGETAEFIASHHLEKKFGLVSTGGGAMLEYLSGKQLPGIVALEKSRSRLQ